MRQRTRRFFRVNCIRVLRVAGVTLLLLCSISNGFDLAAADDSFVAGYVGALLEHEFELSSTIHVANGTVTVYAVPATRGHRQKILAALAKIPGVVDAALVDARHSIPDPPPGTTVAYSHATPDDGRFLPKGLLFEPLHADPRWPHFSATYRNGTAGPDPRGSFSGNFGDTFALFRHNAPLQGQWEFGLQGGVFSVFNVGSSSGSQDLFNADYVIAVMGSYRTGSLSGFIRLYHLSAHLGDEFILNSKGPVNRLGLAYDGIDTKWSYEIFDWLRLYGGGGILINVDPADLKRGTSQFGIELVYPHTLFGDTIRPVFYSDFQANQRTDWSIGRSIMAGIRFEHFRIFDRNIQLLFEYYGGPSPNGDFLFQKTEWFGIGLHFYP